jgi:hypothetical protein
MKTRGELEEECAALQATGQALSRHIYALNGDASPSEVEAFRAGIGIPATEANRAKVSKLLSEFIQRRQRAGQFAAFGVQV